MYQVARDAPQRRSVTFNPVLYLQLRTADDLNREMRIVSPCAFVSVQLKQH